MVIVVENLHRRKYAEIRRNLRDTLNPFEITEQLQVFSNKNGFGDLLIFHRLPQIYSPFSNATTPIFTIGTRNPTIRWKYRMDSIGNPNVICDEFFCIGKLPNVRVSPIN